MCLVSLSVPKSFWLMISIFIVSFVLFAYLLVVSTHDLASKTTIVKLNGFRTEIRIHLSSNDSQPMYYEENGLNLTTANKVVSIMNDYSVSLAAKSPSEGKFVPYRNNFNIIRSHGRYFEYFRKANSCEVHDISLKYNQSCGDSTPEFMIKPLLIVAVQRSGTHYMWEMLNRLGIDLHHEGVGSDGAVSWFYAVNARESAYGNIKFFSRTYLINNPSRMDTHRFRHIFHQVRHPLRVISTLVSRCASFDRYWSWISKVKGFESINSKQTPLLRAMLLYLLWNRHIERYADLRYQTEITSPRDVCKWAGFDERCLFDRSVIDSVSPIVEPVSSNIVKNPDYVMTTHFLVDIRHKKTNIRKSPSASIIKSRVDSSKVSTNPQNLIARLYRPNVESAAGGSNAVTLKHDNNHLLMNNVVNLNALTERRFNDDLSQLQAHQDIIGVRGRILTSSSPSSDSNDIKSGSEQSNATSNKIKLTWKELEAEDLLVAQALQAMCLEYGYDLDPAKAPQNIDTEMFTA